MTRWRSYAGDALPGFRAETRERTIDLTERVRTLEACLRNTAPDELSAEETRALQGLLETVHNLTVTPRG